MTVSFKISRATALAATTLALGLGAFAAAPASAQAAGAAPATAAGARATTYGVNTPGGTSQVTPDISTFWEYSGSNESGSIDGFECDAGANYTTGNAIIMDPVKSVTNTCEYRVYLQYPGTKQNCVHPHTTRNVVDASFQNPNGVIIGSHPGEKCPS